MSAGLRGRLLHLEQELGVALRLLAACEQQLERLLQVERVEHPAQLPDDLELVGASRISSLTGAGGVDVDGGEDALVGQLAVEHQLHVAGALELLEDDLVHPEPVSTRAVARIVSEPPSSMLRAAPKNRFGRVQGLESTPPDMVRPLAGAAML